MALAQDSAFGQPLESQLRSCLLAHWISESSGFDKQTREDIYWVSLLRYIGCTGHAHEVATVFGDEIAIRAQTLIQNAADPTEVMRDGVAFATAGHSPEDSEQIAQMLQQSADSWAVSNFSSGCEVADMLAQRLGFGPGVRHALRFTFERWNGNGFPTHAKGEHIPLPMRVVHLSHDMEAIARVFSPARALQAALERRDHTYDPAVVDIFIANGALWFKRLAKLEPWDAVLDLEPKPRRVLEGAALDNALTIAADFIDLKSPYMAGHSRRCAQIASDAARLLGLADDVVENVRRAALVHDLGATGVPNSIWDKPGPLTRAEIDRVELHPFLTEQMLRRSALSNLNPVASAHHEKCDGSGYHKRLRANGSDPAACVLAATEVYVGLTTERADRAPFSPSDAAAELSRLASECVLEQRATLAVLAAAGHSQAKVPSRSLHPGGLSTREIEVLCLAAKGFSIQQIAERLFMAPKTADHHIQLIYNKIAVSTRAAAALWAMQNAVIQ